MFVKRHQGMEDLSREKRKALEQSPALSDVSTSTANPDSRYREPEPRGRLNEAPAARSLDDNQYPQRKEGRQGNQYNRSSSVDSQFRQPLQERDQQARGPIWNAGIPPGAADFRPQGQKNRPFRRGCFVCGQLNCHSRLHRNNEPPSPRPRSQTPPPSASNRPLEQPLLQHIRDLFTPWEGYE